MNYSILLPYYHRPQLKGALLSFIHHYSERHDYEIIIIEDLKNSETPGKHDELLGIIKEFTPKLNIIHIIDPIRSCSPVTKYNLGFKKSHGKFIVLSNPEIFHLSNVLAGLDVEFSVSKNRYVVCACESKIYDNPIFNTYEDHAGGRSDMWYQHTAIRNKRYHFCSAIPRNLYAKIGGFDERFIAGYAYDDDNFLERVEVNGIPILATDNLVTIHINHDHDYIQNQVCNVGLYQRIQSSKDYFEPNEIRNMYNELEEMPAFNPSPSPSSKSVIVTVPLNQLPISYRLAQEPIPNHNPHPEKRPSL